VKLSVVSIMAGVLGDLIAGINSDDLDQQLRGTKGVRVFLSVGKRLMPSKMTN
jgi:hypothetical protein